MACSRRAIPVVMGVREDVMVLGVVVVVLVVGVLVFRLVVRGGVRVCQMLVASGRRVEGSVMMGSVPRRKKMDLGGLVKSEGWGEVMVDM